MQKSSPRARHTLAALLIPAMLWTSPVLAAGPEDSMWPEHIEAVSDAGAELSGLIISHLERSEAAKEMWALFNAPVQPLPDRLSLEGTWQVRSLQVHQFGANVYDYFPCRIRSEGPTGLVLDKNRGSQKRIGLILGDYAEDAFLFLGGSYTTGEDARSYSAFEVDDLRAEGATESIDRSRDSVGLIEAIGPNHLRIIFAPVGGKSEMYELKR